MLDQRGPMQLSSNPSLAFILAPHTQGGEEETELINNYQLYAKIQLVNYLHHNRLFECHRLLDLTVTSEEELFENMYAQKTRRCRVRIPVVQDRYRRNCRSTV